MHVVSTLFLTVTIMFLAGCGAQKSKIVIPSYSAPKEIQKIEMLKSGGENSEGAYLTFAINPEVKNTTKKDTKLIRKGLISNLKSGITETNFISLYPIYDTAHVVLDMEVLDYQFKKTDKQIRSNIKVSFTLSKGTSGVMTKIYNSSKSRFSSDPNKLPSKSEIVFDLTEDVTDKFIADISPRKTNQLREFKPLPSQLSHIEGFARKGNFQSAIADMENFTGQKDMNYYYDLAILYEALGSTTEDLKVSEKAKEAYEKAFVLGGNTDETIAAAKARFDNFYRLLKLTRSQQQQNKKLNQELNETYGIKE